LLKKGHMIFESSPAVLCKLQNGKGGMFSVTLWPDNTALKQ